jgi:hypothetical protein
MKADGYVVKRSGSVQVWFVTRGLGTDPKAAEAVLRQHRLYAWSQRERPPETKFVPVGGKAWSSEQPHDLRYWRYLADVLQPEPIEARDRYFIAMLQPLGIEPGKLFTPDARQEKLLTEAAQVGELMARTIAYDKRFRNATVWPGKHWEYANLVELNQETPHYAHLDGRASWFYEAIGNSVSMQGRMLGFGQVYLEVSKAQDGAWLNGVIADGVHLALEALPVRMRSIRWSSPSTSR